MCLFLLTVGVSSFGLVGILVEFGTPDRNSPGVSGV
tara:strand:- start:873 stop:980 length:108 start_codon:yes stop_codon:yes gene_type:complete